MSEPLPRPNLEPQSAEEIAIEVARFLDSKRAEDVVILNVRDVLYITSYFVLATGSSARAIRNLADGVVPLLRKTAFERVGVEHDQEGRWICVDYSEVVVHLFDRDARSFYDMDHLWSDAPRVAFPPAGPDSTDAPDSTGPPADGDTSEPSENSGDASS